MSKEKSSSTKPSETPSSTAAGKGRPAKSRSKKTAKSAKSPKPAQAEPLVEKASPAYPVFDSPEPSPGYENENPESASSGGPSSQEGVKRNKRRRKKGKSAGSQTGLTETLSESAGEVTAPSPRSTSQPRLKLDPDSVAKLAWKIYLAEVSEEGVALIGDSDARELARRCFRLAEIFMEEQSRRR